jgi:hypothetical protein
MAVCYHEMQSRDQEAAAGHAWRASSYDDPTGVIAEAVADVTRDARCWPCSGWRESTLEGTSFLRPVQS